MIRRLLTDLMPLDLTFTADKEGNAFYLRFDWRKYFSAVYGEEQEIIDLSANHVSGATSTLDWAISDQYSM